MKYQSVTETTYSNIPEDVLIRENVIKLIKEIPLETLKHLFNIEITEKEIYEFPDHYPLKTVIATLNVKKEYENYYSDYARKMESNNSKYTQE